MSHRDILRQQGICYPDGLKVFKNNKVSHHRFSHSLNGARPGGQEAARTYVSRLRQSMNCGDRALISAEPLYRHVYGHDRIEDYRPIDYWTLRERYLRNVAEALSEFDVEVILFFRQTESFARSLLYGTEAKDHWANDIEEFKLAYAPWFEYQRQTELFRTIFGTVRTFSYEEASSSGLISTFCSAIGCSLPEEALDTRIRKTEYPEETASA